MSVSPTSNNEITMEPLELDSITNREETEIDEALLSLLEEQQEANAPRCFGFDFES